MKNKSLRNAISKECAWRTSRCVQVAQSSRVATIRWQLIIVWLTICDLIYEGYIPSFNNPPCSRKRKILEVGQAAPKKFNKNKNKKSCKARGSGARNGGEPAVSYKWTGWVWEIAGWLRFKDCRKSTDHFRGIYRIYPNLIKENPEDVNQWLGRTGS